VINTPGPTPPLVSTGTYTGASGTWAFMLDYAEVSGAPAVLQVDLPFTAVPEPSTFLAGALLAIPFGLQSLRFLRRK
jgi:hypothetical protein